MTPERYRQIRELFEETLQQPAAARSGFLRRACAGDEKLHSEVQSLLAADAVAGTFMENPAPDVLLSHRSDEFSGTERFQVIRRLGAGGYGIVYQVLDRQENAVLALKTLPHAHPTAIARFKREFRALAHITHPHLVALYELISDGRQWFFTMEFIDGVDFLRHTSCGPQPFDRLREGLRQLSEGISTLHEAGKLHCDLKPQNVLVNRDGRVVILDFGLVTEIVSAGMDAGGLLLGTPVYMSPEQAGGQKLSPATDWYSIGVMLYEALTGVPPFDGTPRSILLEKQRRPPDPPCTITPDIPEDLNDLCVDLLQLDAALRPSAEEVLRRLGATKSEIGLAFVPRLSARLVGRESELNTLYHALHSAEGGRTTSILVHGRSGVGKSALASHFLDEVRRRGKCVVLEGRCYERESVPFKALDGVVDSLNQYLKSLPQAELSRVLPHDLVFLSRLFPVLREIGAGTQSSLESTHITEPKELRLQAFRVLHDLLAKIASRKPLVLFVDDLQWGDIDSVPFLADLLYSTQPLSLLIIACYRSDEVETSPLLSKLLSSRKPDHTIDLPVTELSHAGSRDLAQELLAEEGVFLSDQAEQIAVESGGNPLFIGELVKYSRTARRRDAGPLSLDDLLRQRISSLPEQARRLLRMVTVAGQPVEINVAKRAAALAGGARSELLQLSTACLVRIRRTENTEEVEAYHDRVRHTTAGSLDTETVTDCHYRLAVAWEAADSPDCRALAVHFRGAGLLEKAHGYALQAADQAAAALAFDSAANFYRFALDMKPTSQGEEALLYRKLGDALSNAGRGADSAQAYIIAAQPAVGIEKIELQRRAATQFLISGHIEQSLGLVSEVLQAIGMKLPRSAWGALLSFFVRRVWIRIRGLRFKERNLADITDRELLRVDICTTMVHGLAMVDTIRAHPFQAKGLLLALQCGEPYRMSRALCAEAAYFALGGGRHRRKVEDLLATAGELAERGGNPHGPAIVALVRGMSAFLQGRWRAAVDAMRLADTLLRERCAGVSWEIATAHMMSSVSLYLMGRLKGLAERLPQILASAERRGDLFEITDLRIRLSHTICLAGDRTDRAYQEIEAALAGWRRKDFDLQHWWALIGRIEVDLYSGEPLKAWDRIRVEWPSLRRSFLMRVQYIYIESLHHRARAALAVAASGKVAQSECRKLIRGARRDTTRIERQGMPWGNALAALLRAGIWAVLGEREKAADLLALAEPALRAADMELYAAAALRSRGTISSVTLIEKADAWMRVQNICNPPHMARMLAPGFSQTPNF